jgi:serine/threonine protein kinase
MASIFQRKDSEVNPEVGFWQSIPEDFSVNSINILHHDVVRIKAGFDLVEVKLLLGDSDIYLYDDSPEDGLTLFKRADIHWKHFEPFVEEMGSALLHGFKIGAGRMCEEFYTLNSAKLDVWVANLRGLCILSEIKSDFTITKMIGKGSYAMVYQGFANDNRSEIAVKRIKKSTIDKSEKHIFALENEIAALRLMNHPRIAKLYRVYESKRDICLILEAVMGGELLDRISAKSKFPETTVKPFAQKMLEVLQYMHSKGVVHRDLKPENILMTSQEDDVEFKIIDFGLAAVCSSARLLDRCGSPGYVAPEVLEKQPYDFKVDVFSLGVVLYIMLSGMSPFSGDTQREVLRKNQEGVINFKTQEFDNASIDFIKLLRNLTQIDPELRPTAAEALQCRLFCSRLREEEPGSRPERVFKGAVQFNHIKRNSVSKPDFFLKEGQLLSTLAYSNSPPIKPDSRKFLNIKVITANHSAESSPMLPPLRSIVSPTATRGVILKKSPRIPPLPFKRQPTRKMSREETAPPRQVINLLNAL